MPPNISITIPSFISIANETKLRYEIATCVGTAIPSRVLLSFADVDGTTVCTLSFAETALSANTALSSLWLSFRFRNGWENREPLFMQELGYLIDSGATVTYGTLPSFQPQTPPPPTTRDPALPPLFFNPAPNGGKVQEANMTFGEGGSEEGTSTSTGVIIAVVVGGVVIGGGVGFIKWYTSRQQNQKGGSKYVAGNV
jgi:hypothetical protein